jgi:hypothetical protein
MVNRAVAVVSALSLVGCFSPALTRVDRNIRFDRTSADAIVVFGFHGKFDVWLSAGIDDGVNWACGTGRPRIWRIRPENGFIVARLPPRTGKNKYAIRQIGDPMIAVYGPTANAPVWVFNAEPGKVTYVGAVRVVWSGHLPAVVEDSEVTAEEADEFVTRSFPNIPDHAVSRPMTWIYMSMGCG